MNIKTKTISTVFLLGLFLLTEFSCSQVFVVPLVLKTRPWAHADSFGNFLSIVINDDFSFIKPGISDRISVAWAEFARRIGSVNPNVFFYQDGPLSYEMVLKIESEQKILRSVKKVLQIDQYFIFIGLCMVSSFITLVDKGFSSNQAVYKVLEWTLNLGFKEKMLEIAQQDPRSFGFSIACVCSGFASIENVQSFYSYDRNLIQVIAQDFVYFSQAVSAYLIKDGDTTPEALVEKINYLKRFFITLGAVYLKASRLPLILGKLESSFNDRMLDVLFDFYPEKSFLPKQVFSWLGIIPSRGMAFYSPKSESEVEDAAVAPSQSSPLGECFLEDVV